MSTTRPPTRKANSSVMNGAMIPPPRRYVAIRVATVEASAPSRSSGPTLITASAGHVQAEVLLGGLRRELGHDAALIDHQDAIRQRADLLHLERDEQHAAARVTLLDQPPVHELDRADVQPAGRLRGDDHARVGGELA